MTEKNRIFLWISAGCFAAMAAICAVTCLGGGIETIYRLFQWISDDYDFDRYSMIIEFLRALIPTCGAAVDLLFYASIVAFTLLSLKRRKPMTVPLAVVVLLSAVTIVITEIVNSLFGTAFYVFLLEFGLREAFRVALSTGSVLNIALTVVTQGLLLLAVLALLCTVHIPALHPATRLTWFLPGAAVLMNAVVNWTVSAVRVILFLTAGQAPETAFWTCLVSLWRLVPLLILLAAYGAMGRWMRQYIKNRLSSANRPADTSADTPADEAASVSTSSVEPVTE